MLKIILISNEENNMSELSKPPAAEKKEAEPSLENIRSGTWAYTLDLYGKGIGGVKYELSASETVERLNKALELIKSQSGRVVNLMEINVREAKGGSFGGAVEKATIIIVEK